MSTIPTPQEYLRDYLAGKTPQAANDQPVTYEDELAQRRQADLDYRIRLAKPDEAAKANALSREVGVPAPLVRGNLPAFEAQRNALGVAAVAKDSPGFARWAADQRNAEIAADDYSSLSALGKAMYGVANIGKSLLAGANTASAGLYGAIAAGFELEDAYSPVAWAERQFGGISRAGVAAKSARALQASGKKTADTTRPDVDDWTARNLLTGIESLPLTAVSIAAGLAGGPGTSAAIMGGSVGGNEYVRARDIGRSPITSAIYATSQGAIEFATEKIPASKLLTDIAQKSPIGKTLLHQLVSEIPGEQAATALQDLNEWAVLHPDKPFVDYLKSRPMAAAETAIATIGGVGATVGVTQTAQRTAEVVGKIAKRGGEADAAVDASSEMDAVMKAAAESKARARDPEAFKALIAEMAQDGDVQELFVPAEAVNSYMQSDGYAGEFDSFRDAVEEGLATGGDVVIPIDHVVSRLSGTPAWDVIRDDARITAGGMSLREAATFNEDMADHLADLSDQMENEARTAKEAAAPREQLVQSLTERLQDAGFTPHTARQQAELLAQKAATRATRLGRELTGTEFDDLAINQVPPENLAQAQKADRLDFVINAMKRKADVNAKPGMSLIEFINAKGGVQDPGGDLQAMGAQDWHKGKPGKRKLIQEQGRTLDDLALAAFEAGYFPGLTERPSINDLLDAMGRELGGAPVFANFASEQAAGADAAQAQLVEAADELRSLLQEAGLDPDKATAREIRQAVAQFSEQAQGEGFDQTDIDYSIRSDGSIEVSMIRTPEDERGQGQARAALESLLRAADAEGRTVYLTPEPVGKGGASKAALVKFYKSLGFKARARSDFSSRASMVREPQSFDQAFADGPRGRITFPTSGYGRGKTIIDLFQSRNQSTFLHEAGHMWLEELRFDASHPDAPEQLRADWQTVQDWFAANGHPLEDGIIPVEAHEMWARSVERYLMEGKAPVPALRSLFETLKSWLKQVYRTVDRLNAPITDDVRAVMDRLIASDAEIEQARQAQAIEAGFTEKPATMSDAEWQSYQALTTKARDTANDTLLGKVMAAIKRRVTKEYKEQAAIVREEVVAEIDRRPEFRALRQLRETPMDRATIAETYGEDALAMLPKQVPPVYKTNGADLNEVAELSGFTSADEMVRTLMGMETARLQLKEGGDPRSVREVTIAQKVDAIMLERHGDPFTDGSIEEEALAAVHSDDQGEVMAAELRVLSRSTGNRPTPYSVAKAWAARTIRAGKVRDTTSRSAIQRYRRAAAKAGAAFQEAIIAGDNDAAFKAKQAQMLNNALLAEGERVAREVESAVKRLSNWAKRRTVKSVDQDYLERAQALLEQVDMKPRTGRSLERQAGFEAWATEQEELGYTVIVPPSFAASLGSTHWSQLEVDQLLALDMAVAQIIHLGRHKQTLLDGKAARDHEEVVSEALAQNKDERRNPTVTGFIDPGILDRAKMAVLSVDAAMLKGETIMDWMDRGDPNGIYNRLVFQPLAEAQEKRRLLMKDKLEKVEAARLRVPEKTRKRWKDKITLEFIDRFTGKPAVMTRDQLVVMALNMGNEGNAAKLAGGHGWNESAILAMLNRELTPQEWQFVQEVWDIIDEFRPEAFALERRVNGIEPEAVEARAVETSAGTLRGGYYPVTYDPTRNLEVEKQHDLLGASVIEGWLKKPNTKAGSLNERTNVERPILLTMGTINKHIVEMAHDITHREVLMNAHKFLNDPRIVQDVREVLGVEVQKQLNPWLDHIAKEWVVPTAGMVGLERMINNLRTNATFVGLAYRVSTGMMQIAGLFNSAEAIGMRHVIGGINSFRQHPIAATKFVLENSLEVRARMETMDRDIQDAIRRETDKFGFISDVKRFGFYHIGMLDRFVSMATWMGAYNKALAGGMDDTQAIHAADKAVRQSQGGGGAKDLAAIQRGKGTAGAAGKLLTMFYSYLSGFYQRQRTLGRDYGKAFRSGAVEDFPALLARTMWLYFFPALASELLAGRPPDDDEDWTMWAINNIAVSALGPIPLIRDIAGAVESGFGYSFTPASGLGRTAVSVVRNAKKLIEGEETKRATRDVMELAGYVGAPVAGQVAASTQFLVDVAMGEQDPEGFAEWYQGLTKGKVKKE